MAESTPAVLLLLVFRDEDFRIRLKIQLRRSNQVHHRFSLQQHFVCTFHLQAVLFMSTLRGELNIILNIH